MPGRTIWPREVYQSVNIVFFSREDHKCPQGPYGRKLESAFENVKQNELFKLLSSTLDLNGKDLRLIRKLYLEQTTGIRAGPPKAFVCPGTTLQNEAHCDRSD